MADLGPGGRLPLPRRQQVTVEVCEHNGRECAAVTALDGEILAMYRVTRGPARLRLDDSAPGIVEPSTTLTRSVAAAGQLLRHAGTFAALRAHSAVLLGDARSARTAASAAAVRSHARRNGYIRPLDGQLLPVSALARMKAQLATIPVIEQAKGILIARTGCDPSEAFDQLRCASQRANVPIRVLAARLVEQSITRDTVKQDRRAARLRWPPRTRQGRGPGCRNRSGDGDEGQGVTLSSARSHTGSHGMNNLPVLRTRPNNRERRARGRELF